MRRVEAFRIYKSRYASSALTGEEYSIDWRADPSHALLREIGTEWIEAGVSLAMQVPSAVSPSDWNFLLNPAHPDFHTLTFGTSAPVEWDARLLKRLRAN